jgi:hypothetical protein
VIAVGDVPAGAIRRRIETWLRDEATDPAPVLALRVRTDWPDEPAMTIDGTTVLVVRCATPLAVRAALHERVDGQRLVVLTDLDDTDLGEGLLAHVSHQRVRTVNRWQMVWEMFGASEIERALADRKWAADALLDHRPDEGWPPVRGTVLTRAHALRCLTGAVLGIELPRGNGAPAPLDAAGLLEATGRAADLLRFTALPAPVIDGIREFVTESAGPAATPIMAAIVSGHGADAVPLGLIAGALWTGRPAADTDVLVARARLEPRLGTPTEMQGAEFGQVAEAWVQRLLSAGEGAAWREQRRAEAIAAELHITGVLGASTLLPAGFAQRLRTLAAALSNALPAPTTPTLDAVERALPRLREHRNSDHAPLRDQLATAEHAVRLVRWLALPDAAAPGTLHDAVAGYVAEDGWVDRAKLLVHAGSADPAVAAAYRGLFEAVDARRAGHDRRFADLLAAATAANTQPGALLPVEQVLDRVVAPILADRPALLLVLDGMSVAAATRLAEDVVGAGWNELTGGGGPRSGVLAALPTVTEVSRCSLLTGAIAAGKQADEKKALVARFPGSLLVHKGDLRAGAGGALDPEIVAAMADPARRLVAAVVNTIDDALDRSDPGTTDWTQRTIRAVRDLLDNAGDRVVVVLSDHGHVIDRGTETRSLSGVGGGNRWRPGTGPVPREGEIAVHGDRVALGGGRVVLPWREGLRYGPVKAGYHGGASPAEVVIPLLVFSRRDGPVADWSAAPVPSPDWWREPVTATPQATGRRSRPVPAGTEALFDLPAAAVPAAGADSWLVPALLASHRYRQRNTGRGALDDERVAALLSVLLAAPDRRARHDTLGARAHIPANRIRHVVGALRKLLQVEGYPVLDIDADQQTVLLDRGLLIEQFGLAAP